MAENELTPKDQVIARIVQTLGGMSATMSKIDESLNQQTDAIQHTPDKKYINNAVIALAVVLILAVGVSTKFTYDQQNQNQSVARQNTRTVQIYCAVSPELAECTLPGSVTAKAGAILASCRIYENLISATPPERRVPIKTDAACKALGFQP